LLTRRWLGLLVAVVVVGLSCLELGSWQLRRYSDRKDSNESIRANLSAPAVGVDQVMTTTRGVAESVEWTPVVATGRYDDTHKVIVLYRTREGSPGVNVVVPLITTSGTAVLVDRGWVATSANGNSRPDVPPPPPGEVTVTGWVRRNATGDPQQVTPSDGYVRAISSDGIASTLPYDVYDGFVEVQDEDPSVSPAPTVAAQPDLGSGPSFFYGLQWYFFGLLAFAFWLYFAWAEYRLRSAQDAADPAN
jgi:cytochrome oxidase assembly protein ShyY1